MRKKIDEAMAAVLAEMVANGEDASTWIDIKRAAEGVDMVLIPAGKLDNVQYFRLAFVLDGLFNEPLEVTAFGEYKNPSLFAAYLKGYGTGIGASGLERIRRAKECRRITG